MYSYLILDLDDTICDYSGIERTAQTEIASILEMGTEQAAVFWKTFRSVSKDLYRQFSSGSISLEEFRLRRFKDSLPEDYRPRRLEAGFTQLNSTFMEITNGRIALFPDAMDFLERLKPLGIKAILYTNGPDATQRSKIGNLGIEGFFEAIYTSQETGLFKPDEGVYRFLMERHGFKEDQALNIGDSAEIDLPGARLCGIRTIIVNRNGSSLPSSVEFVPSLAEIYSRMLFASPKRLSEEG